MCLGELKIIGRACSWLRTDQILPVFSDSCSTCHPWERGTGLYKVMSLKWSVAISEGDPGRMPEIASLPIGTFPFAKTVPALAMTENEKSRVRHRNSSAMA